MEIELWNGTAKAIIDPVGAWVTNLSDEHGAILFPKRSLKTKDGATKVRGGCHVCLPNFGPGGASGQPQHGFGRELVWQVREQTDHSVVLDLKQGRAGYEQLSSTLRYSLNETTFTVELRIRNRGENELRVAPAFHPYFTTLSADHVMINGASRPLEAIAEAQFTTGSAMQLATANRTVMLSAEHLPVWATWTDQLGPYVCLEPTVGGFTFLHEAPALEELLAPGQHKTYTLAITWK